MESMQKHNQLKDNLERVKAKSKESYMKENHTAMPKKMQKKEEKELRKAAVHAESKLHGVWNQEKSKAIDDSKRPEFGCYFGGVNFDKNGKIIR